MKNLKLYLRDDNIMLCVIMLNCILMFLGGFWPSSMWFELTDAFRASLLVLLAFVVLLFIVSILSSAIFGAMAPEYFSNPAISLYSIFRLFSVEGWYELPDATAQNGGASWGTFARIYFSVLVFLGGILGMSLINSVFVDAMVEDNNDDVLEKLEHIEIELQELKVGKDD